MTDFNCINCGFSNLKLVKNIFESETKARYHHQEDLTKTPTVDEILGSSNNVAIISQSPLALRLGQLDIQKLNDNDQKIETKLTNLGQTILELEVQTSKLPKANMFISVRMITHLIQVFFGLFLMTSFPLFVEIVSSDIGASTLGFSMILWTPLIIIYSLLPIIFCMTSLINIILTYEKYENQSDSRLEFKKLRDKLRETILFVFFSYIFWLLLILILLGIGSNWLFIKISLSILLTISFIELCPIWLSFKTVKFLPD